MKYKYIYFSASDRKTGIADFFDLLFISHRVFKEYLIKEYSICFEANDEVGAKKAALENYRSGRGREMCIGHDLVPSLICLDTDKKLDFDP
jgi:hypothetical protein